MSQLKSKFGKLLLRTFSVAIFARIAQLFLAVLLARELGTHGYGVFTFVLGAATIISQFSSLGFPMLMTRYIPKYTLEKDWNDLKGLIFTGNWVIFFTTILSSFLTYYASQNLNFLRNDISFGLMLAAPLIMPLTFRILRRQQLIGLKHSSSGLFIDEAFTPILLILAIIILKTGSFNEYIAISPELYVYIFFFISVISAILGLYFFERSLPKTTIVKKQIHFKLWITVAIPMMIGISAKFLMNKTDIFMLAPLSTLGEVGIYGSCFRITYLLTFPQIVLMTIFSPLFSEAFSKGDICKLRKKAKLAIFLSVLITTPLALTLILFPEQILTIIFGIDFSQGASTLSTLAISQFAASISIPLSAILLMTGNEKFFGIMNIIVLSINICLNFLWIPQHGALGAAMSTTVSAFILLFIQLIKVYKTLRNNLYNP